MPSLATFSPEQAWSLRKAHTHRYASRAAAPRVSDRDGRAVASPRSYDRRAELPRVLPLWPHELDDETSAGRRNIVCKLRRALRAERRRGIAGHWTYDLSRHVELLRIYRLELASSGLRDIKRG
jgi:hypothetical protein